MRTIYKGLKEMLKKAKECPSCGGPKQVKLVGKTLGGKPLYHCTDKWHDE